MKETNGLKQRLMFELLYQVFNKRVSASAGKNYILWKGLPFTLDIHKSGRGGGVLKNG